MDRPAGPARRPRGILGPTEPLTASAPLLAPQRPRTVREHPGSAGYLLEPEWAGTRALVRVGLGEPRFLGYRGVLDAGAELHAAITAAVACASAVLDGVIVPDFRPEADLEADGRGSALIRQPAPRTVYAVFDLLWLDGESLLEVPLLERKRQLAAVVRPSATVLVTPYVTRGRAAWHEGLREQGFARIVLKAPGSTYAPGRTTDDWLVVERPGDQARRGT